MSDMNEPDANDVVESEDSIKSWSEQKPWYKALTVFLIVAIVACIAATIYIVNTGHGESFTEFYILGSNGKAENYPTEMKRGEEAKVIIGIVNRENAEMSYKVYILINSGIADSVGPVTLKNEEKWENTVSFRLTDAGMNQKVEFMLYKQIEEVDHLRLRLLVNVK